MYQVIIVVHIFLGLGIIGLVLMQQGKGADAGAAFAGGGSGSVFGAQGASSFLSRTTAILAAFFFATSLGLAVLSGYQNKAHDLMDESVIEKPITDVPLADESKVVTDSPVIPDTPEAVSDTVKVDEVVEPSVVNETEIAPAEKIETTAHTMTAPAFIEESIPPETNTQQ